MSEIIKKTFSENQVEEIREFLDDENIRNMIDRGQIELYLLLLTSEGEIPTRVTWTEALFMLGLSNIRTPKGYQKPTSE